MRQRARLGGMLAPLSLAVLVLFGSPAAAGAADWRITQPIEAGPVLAGDQVEWIAGRSDLGGALYLARGGDAPRRIQRFGRTAVAGYDYSYLYSLESSSTHSLVSQYTDACFGTGTTYGECQNEDELFGGRVGSQLAPIQRCGTWFDLSGRFASFSDCDGRLVIRDLEHRVPDRVVGHDGGVVSMAGRYVAWYRASDSDIQVYDRLANRPVYRVKTAHRFEGGLVVQRDGKVAFNAVRNPSDLHDVSAKVWIVWAAPDASYLHWTPVAHRFGHLLRMANDRIVFAYDRDDDGTLRVVGVRQLGGGTTAIITRLSPVDSEPDFDGRRIAYAVKEGNHVVIRRETIR